MLSLLREWAPEFLTDVQARKRLDHKLSYKCKTLTTGTGYEIVFTE